MTPAGALYGGDVDRLLGRLSARQVTEWLAYAELEPFGPLREDRRAAEVAVAVYNTAMGRGKGTPPVKVEQVFTSLKERGGPREQPWKEQKRQLTAVTRRMGGAAPADKVQAHPLVAAAVRTKAKNRAQRPPAAARAPANSARKGGGKRKR